MALPSSGEIKLSQVATEFGSDGSTQLTDYNRGGGQVPVSPSTTGISGTDAGLQLSQFYAKSSVFFSSWNIAGDLNFRVGGPSSTWGTFNRDVNVNLTKANDTGSNIVFNIFGGENAEIDTQLDVTIPNGQSSGTTTFPIIINDQATAYDQQAKVSGDYGTSGNILLNFYTCRYRFTFSYNIQTSLGYLWDGTFDFDTRTSTGYLWDATYKQDTRTETTVTQQFWTGTFNYRSVSTVTNTCRTSGCGCQTYNFCQNSACGTTTTCTSFGVSSNQAAAAGFPGCQPFTVSECQNFGFTDCRSCCRSSTTTTNSCRTSGCGCQTYNSCQNSACGTSTVYGATQSATAFTNAGPYTSESAALNGEGFSAFNNTGCKSSTPGSCNQDSSTQQIWNVGATVTNTTSTSSYGDWVFQGTFTAFDDAGPYASGSDALNGQGFAAFNNSGCKSSTAGSCNQDTDTVRFYAVTTTQGAEQYGDWVPQPTQLAFDDAGPYATESDALNGEGFSAFNNTGCKSSTPGSCNQDTATTRFYNVQATQGAEQFGSQTTTAVTGDGADGGNTEYITHVEGAPLGSAIAAKEGFTGAITITSAVRSNSNDSRCPTSGELS